MTCQAVNATETVMSFCRLLGKRNGFLASGGRKFDGVCVMRFLEVTPVGLAESGVREREIRIQFNSAPERGDGGCDVLLLVVVLHVSAGTQIVIVSSSMSGA